MDHKNFDNELKLLSGMSCTTHTHATILKRTAILRVILEVIQTSLMNTKNCDQYKFKLNL
jgi:hypothetical protein